MKTTTPLPDYTRLADSQIVPLANACSILGHCSTCLPRSKRAKVREAARLAEQARDLLAEALKT